ncbi:Sec-independent protein translocase protein TatA [Vibrio stylophorae]|uniref:Sec-independent protein translocase protein TatA n=1 Tax=Vibrio stylophorae TaxID=659351 RepID=A0ABN8DQ32_9VIBR|nr:twin-arginine translocase TatA/TatE family subunit [Vibrio stylophorae]CAH0532264.1 Sec-independent protein translocase protein TatA [Vibrio stylophorae]
MGSFGIKELLLIAVIVLLVFGTKKLRTMGGDLGTAIKGFKKAMSEDDKSETKPDELEKKDADFNKDSVKDADKTKQD